MTFQCGDKVELWCGAINMHFVWQYKATRWRCRRFAPIYCRCIVQLYCWTFLVMVMSFHSVISYFHLILLALLCLLDFIETEAAYVNILTRGDLSSLRWIESPLKYFVPQDSPDKELCTISYSALNFLDIMVATGKLPPDIFTGLLLKLYAL